MYGVRPGLSINQKCLILVPIPSFRYWFLNNIFSISVSIESEMKCSDNIGISDICMLMQLMICLFVDLFVLILYV